MNIDKSKHLMLNAKFRKTLYIILALLTIVFFIQTIGKAYRPNGYDLSAYIYGANALIKGLDPYYQRLAFIYIYPLFLAFIMTPLMILPYWMINTVWFFLGIGCLYFISVNMLNITKEITKCEDEKKYILPIFISIVICFSSIHNTFLNGQVNLLVLACDVMFFSSFFNKKYISSSIWLAAAIAIKLTPIILLGFLFIRKRYGLLLMTILISVFFILLPSVLCGEKIISYYNFYINNFILHKFTATDSVIKDIEGFAPGFNLQSVIGLSYPPAFKSFSLKLFSLLSISILIVWVDIISCKNIISRYDFFGFSAYVIGSLLLSPMGENHHTVAIYPIVLVLVSMIMFNGAWRFRFPRFLSVLFLLSFLVMPSFLKPTAYYFIPLFILLLIVFVSANYFCGNKNERFRGT
jgi:hypothetical protein